MSVRTVFVLKVLGLSLAAAVLLIPLCGFAGLFLYIFLNPRMSSDSLASLSFFFLLWFLFSPPALIAAARLALLRRGAGLQLFLMGLVLLMGTLGFAGFWVGAMGI